MALHVARWGTGYAVFDGKVRKTRAYSHRELALRQMDLMEEAARREGQARERACLSCGARFWSECFGHRMCNRCRERKSGLDARMLG
ncbi:hypothetical protein [Roseovarius sp. MBR-6]|jgi:hypothetical protein|uniref:hypothetical protein n=1 Tax=Roseovarius sp. MBR-6 TaxID=3156459 RepID=UPI0033936261